MLVTVGLLFSGYLSGVKLISGSCALNEPCPYFLGYPACWYGFVMYLAMFVVTVVALINEKRAVLALKTNIAVSFLGILFAGNFVLQEIGQSTVTGTLGLSTCAYGFIFYLAIFIASLIFIRKSRI